MDNKAFYKLTYGVFMLSVKSGEKVNGCITNTCMQVASSPTKIAISVLNTNYTCDLIKERGMFALSMLSEDCTFETIRHFGFQSGRNVNKFDGLTMPADCNGIPYMGWHACAVLSGKVLEQIDLGSHTLFIAEVVDAVTLNDKAPLTYADYQARVKPKPEKKAEDKKIVGWRCRICNYVYEGSELPADYSCPVCGHGPEDFEPIYG